MTQPRGEVPEDGWRWLARKSTKRPRRAPHVGGPTGLVVTDPSGWTTEDGGKRNAEENKEIVRAALANSKAATKLDST